MTNFVAGAAKKQAAAIQVVSKLDRDIFVAGETVAVAMIAVAERS